MRHHFAVIAAIHFCSSFLQSLSTSFTIELECKICDMRIRESMDSSLTCQTEVASPALAQAASDAFYLFAPQTAVEHSSSRHDRLCRLLPAKIWEEEKEMILGKAGW